MTSKRLDNSFKEKPQLYMLGLFCLLNPYSVFRLVRQNAQVLSRWLHTQGIMRGIEQIKRLLPEQGRRHLWVMALLALLNLLTVLLS